MTTRMGITMRNGSDDEKWASEKETQANPHTRKIQVEV